MPSTRGLSVFGREMEIELIEKMEKREKEGRMVADLKGE